MTASGYNHKVLTIKCCIESETIKKNEFNIKNPSINDWDKNLKSLLSKISKKFKFLMNMDESLWSIQINGQIANKQNPDQLKEILQATPPIPVVEIVKTQIVADGYIITVHYKDKLFDYKLNTAKDDWDEDIYQDLQLAVGKEFNLYSEFGLIDSDKIDIDDMDDVLDAFEDEEGPQKKVIHLYVNKIDEDGYIITIHYGDKQLDYKANAAKDDWDENMSQELETAIRKEFDLQSEFGLINADKVDIVDIDDLLGEFEDDDDTDKKVLHLYVKVEVQNVNAFKIICGDESFEWIPPKAEGDDEKEWEENWNALLSEIKKKYNINRDDIELQQMITCIDVECDELKEIWQELIENDNAHVAEIKIADDMIISNLNDEDKQINDIICTKEETKTNCNDEENKMNDDIYNKEETKINDDVESESNKEEQDVDREINLDGIKSTLIWSEKNAKWIKISKKSTIKIYQSNDGMDKWMVMVKDIKSDQVKFNHVIPIKDASNFKYVEDKMCCQWMGKNDLIQKENDTFTIYIKFESKQAFKTFIDLFEKRTRPNKTSLCENNTPNEIQTEPGSQNEVKTAMESWFDDVLNLPQYYQSFVDAGYQDLDYLDSEIDEDELINDIGVKKKSDRKKILAEIHKLKQRDAQTLDDENAKSEIEPKSPSGETEKLKESEKKQQQQQQPPQQEIKKEEHIKQEFVKKEEPKEAKPTKPKHKMKGKLAAKFGHLNFNPTTMKVGAAPPRRRKKEKQEIDQSVVMNKAIVSKKGRRRRTKKKVQFDEDQEENTAVSASLFAEQKQNEKEQEQQSTPKETAGSDYNDEMKTEDVITTKVIKDDISHNDATFQEICVTRGYYYTLREMIIFNWCQECVNSDLFVYILPMILINLISYYLPPFNHEIFLLGGFSTIQPNRITFNFQDYNIHIMSIYSCRRVILDMCVTGENIKYFGYELSTAKFEFILCDRDNALITEESQQFVKSLITKTNDAMYSISSFLLRSTNFDDDNMFMLCKCMEWRLSHNLPITFEILDFQHNEITDRGFELFCEFLPFMYQLQSISFDRNQLSDASLSCLMKTLINMEQKEVVNMNPFIKKKYSLHSIDLSNNLFSFEMITMFFQIMQDSETSFMNELDIRLDNLLNYYY